VFDYIPSPVFTHTTGMTQFKVWADGVNVTHIVKRSVFYIYPLTYLPSFEKTTSNIVSFQNWNVSGLFYLLKDGLGVRHSTVLSVTYFCFHLVTFLFWNYFEWEKVKLCYLICGLVCHIGILLLLLSSTSSSLLSLSSTSSSLLSLSSSSSSAN